MPFSFSFNIKTLSRNAARRDGGKPEAKPQGGTEGGREKAARPDRGSALSSVGNSRPERDEVSARHGIR